MENPKKEAIDLIERLPDGVNTADIIEELYFKWQVDEGLKDVVWSQVEVEAESATGPLNPLTLVREIVDVPLRPA